MANRPLAPPINGEKEETGAWRKKAAARTYNDFPEKKTRLVGIVDLKLGHGDGTATTAVGRRCRAMPQVRVGERSQGQNERFLFPCSPPPTHFLPATSPSLLQTAKAKKPMEQLLPPAGARTKGEKMGGKERSQGHGRRGEIRQCPWNRM